MTEYDFIDPDLPEKREETEGNTSHFLIDSEDEVKEISDRDIEKLRDAGLLPPEGMMLDEYPELRHRALQLSNDGIIVPEDSDYADTDNPAAEDNNEDSRGFLGRAYNRVTSTIGL